MKEGLIFEKNVPGRKGYALPRLDVPEADIREIIPERFLREKELNLPEVSEPDVVRHYTRLSQENFGVDLGFYPLGSCTMKYNPKINENIANLPGFTDIHPLQPESLSQGALGLMVDLAESLEEIAGMKKVTLQPAAGAHGELAGLLMIRAFHEKHGNPRKTVLIPDSAHGTNPASAVISGYSVKAIKSNRSGLVDLEDLKRNINEECAGFMLTNPNTLGLFEREILEIQEALHQAGALLYMDGANLNAFLGLCRPGDMGFDVVHFNLHKTFTVPHGGGGPGAGALGVSERLVPFLPVPIVDKNDKGFFLNEDYPDSIGRLHGFYGNFGNMVRAYTYVRRMGHDGLVEVSRNAILNANYIRKRLEDHYPIPFNRPCMHEVVLSAKRFRSQGVHAWDIAKRLIDYGFHPPTVNFPLVVDEAVMIEPTETESKETLDLFCDAMISIAKEIQESPDKVTGAPLTTRISRLNETKAVKDLNVRWTFDSP